MMGKTQIEWKKHIPLLGVLLLLFSAGPYIYRHPWFDEVLTLDWLVYPFSEIPYRYSIPNNHIFYTLCLSIWQKFCGIFHLYGVLYLRIFSLLTGCAAVFLIARRMNRAGGFYASLPILILLAGSGPLLLFSTALRGYILSLLLVFTAFIAAEAWMKRKKKVSLFLFFLFSYFTVWTIPTNVLALCTGLLFVFPHKRDSRKWGGFFALCVCVIAAFLMAYLPIFQKFLKVISLKEGWYSLPGFLWNFYGTLLVVFFPVFLFCIIGFFRLWKRKILRWRLLCFTAIFLVPAVLGLFFQMPPFPRVFFPLFGIYSLILCYGLSGFTGKQRGVLKNLPVFFSVVWILLLSNCSGLISEKLFGSNWNDDLLHPYPMSVKFIPNKISKRLAQAYFFEKAEHVFIDFDADPPSLQFQLLQQNVPADFVVRDRADLGRVQWIFPSDWIVCRDFSALEKLKQRFSLNGEYHELGGFEESFQKIFVPSKFYPQTE